MPIGLVSPQPLSAGIAPSNVVTPPSNVITPDAVTALVDSFHKGVITGNDLADHVGLVAAAKNKSTIQQMREYVSPQAIEARQSALDAQTAQNQLATAGAQAQTGLVQPSTDLALAKLGLEQVQTQMGPTGLAAIQQNGWMFGKTMDDFRTPDGRPDILTAAKEGNKMAGQLSLANAWLERLQPTGEPMKTTDAAGGEHTHYLNSRKEDVTPPLPNQGYPGSPMYWQIVKELKNYLPEFHPMRSKLMMTKASGGEANSLRPGPIVDGAPTNLVGPQAPQNQEDPMVDAPTLAPASEGVSTKAAPGAYQTPSAIRADMTADPVVKTMLEQQKYVNSFQNVADEMEKSGATIPGAKVPPQNVNDLGLAESLIKLYDPQAAIREFKWDKLESNQPLLERIGAWKQVALQNGSFTPESRARIIKMGDDLINGSETAARGRLQIAKAAAESSAATAGQDPAKWLPLTLTDNENRILRGEPYRVPKSPAAAASSATASPAGNARYGVLQSGPYKGHTFDKATGTLVN